MENTYKVIVFDNDAGYVTYEKEFNNYDELLNDVEGELLGFDVNDPNEDVSETEKGKWNYQYIQYSLEHFHFANGFCEWICNLPGGHKRITIKLVS